MDRIITCTPKDIDEISKMINQDLKDEINRLRENITELHACAEAWMADYDKLKEKYEPSVMVE